MKHTSFLTANGFKLSMFPVVLSLLLCTTSCSYSVIVVSKRGSPEPDPMHRTTGFYQLKKVNRLDTTVTLSIVQDGVQVNLGCAAAGFHSVEYKITFGDMLRNTFTFGKRRGVRVKYVCLKDTND